jgi:hypothetical protein
MRHSLVQAIDFSYFGSAFVIEGWLSLQSNAEQVHAPL